MTIRRIAAPDYYMLEVAGVAMLSRSAAAAALAFPSLCCTPPFRIENMRLATPAIGLSIDVACICFAVVDWRRSAGGAAPVHTTRATPVTMHPISSSSPNSHTLLEDEAELCVFVTSVNMHLKNLDFGT